MPLADFGARCAAHNLTCCLECSVRLHPFLGSPIRCVCGYEALGEDDLEDHIIAMARVDEEDHAEQR